MTHECGKFGTRVGFSAGKGRGVFATEHFSKGEIVEVSHVIPLCSEDNETVCETVIGNYVYDWMDGSALALGNGSLFNHSSQPNIAYTHLINSNTVVFRALRGIVMDEELTVSYSNKKMDFAGDAWCAEESEDEEESQSWDSLECQYTFKVEILCTVMKYVENLVKTKKATWNEATEFFRWASKNNSDPKKFSNLFSSQKEVNKAWKIFVDAGLPTQRGVRVEFSLWNECALEHYLK